MHAVAFTKNTTAASASVGTLLRHRREAFGLSLEAIEAALTISKRNIAALENDRFEDIPEELYRKCFLKNYAMYLGFDWDEIKSTYRVQTALYHPSLEACETRTTQLREVRRTHLMVPSRMMKNGGIAGVITLCALYLLWLGWGIISPPALAVLSPADNSAVHEGRVIVSGTTNDAADVVINGLPVTKERGGAFRQDVTLAEGLNTIIITASKKYSTPSIITRSIVYRRGDVTIR